MLYVAKKEVVEETSLKNFSEIGQMPISVEILPVKSHNHIKRGYVSAHLHLNVTYLFEADEAEGIQMRENENSAVGWLSFDELIEKSDEPYMIPVYKKIIDRIIMLNK